MILNTDPRPGVLFFVPGIPVAKGSARAFFNRKTGRASVLQTNADRQKPWASMISLKAQEIGLKPTDAGCRLRMRFSMPRPKSHYRTAGPLKPAAAGLPHVKAPDLDKLARCVLDALTGIAYRDDRQVIYLAASKGYANEEPGCTIDIEYEGTGTGKE